MLKPVFIGENVPMELEHLMMIGTHMSRMGAAEESEIPPNALRVVRA